jgi:hypothetical protein
MPILSIKTRKLRRKMSFVAAELEKSSNFLTLPPINNLISTKQFFYLKMN